jgi:hypothetical protein
MIVISVLKSVYSYLVHSILLRYRLRHKMWGCQGCEKSNCLLLLYELKQFGVWLLTRRRNLLLYEDRGIIFIRNVGTRIAEHAMSEYGRPLQKHLHTLQIFLKIWQLIFNLSTVLNVSNTSRTLDHYFIRCKRQEKSIYLVGAMRKSWLRSLDTKVITTRVYTASSHMMMVRESVPEMLHLERF